MGYLQLAKKAREEYRRRKQGGAEPETPAIDLIIDENVVAVLIDSAILGAPIWFDFSDGGHPDQGNSIPIFFPSELPSLRKMTESELRRHYELKRVLGGGWIRKKTAEPTKH